MTENIEYGVIRKKIRNARIKIGNDFKVTAVVPISYSQERLENLIYEKRHWINKTLSRLKNNSKEIKLSQNEILLFGEIYEFVLDESLNDKILTYNNSKSIKSNYNLPEKKSLLLNWYKHLAKKYIPMKASELANKHDFKFERLFIRDQKTKWGTCSAKKNISFNWRLVRCPDFVIEYLIVHELSHLREMNHSKKFWAEVEKIIPDYKRAKKWLLEYESYIFRI